MLAIKTVIFFVIKLSVFIYRATFVDILLLITFKFYSQHILVRLFLIKYKFITYLFQPYYLVFLKFQSTEYLGTVKLAKLGHFSPLLAISKPGW